MINSNNYLMVTNVSPSVAIFIMFTVALLLIPITVLLYFRTKKERQKFSEAKLTGNKITSDVFNLLIDRRLKGNSSKPQFSTIVISIANFKEVADVYGENHYFAAVQKIIQRLKNIFDGSNKICHYQKDEICVIVDDLVDEKAIASTGNIILLELKKPIQLVQGVVFSFDVNIGIVTNDEINNNREMIMKSLEQALVASVQSGINNYIIFNHSLTLGGEEEIKYFKEVKKAIENNEFVLCYQPIVSLLDKKIFGYEALIRWNHKSMGMLQPAKFLKVLEESGNMGWVSIWELETVLSAFKKLQVLNNGRNFFVSLNLSQTQLKNEKFFGDIHSVLKKHDITADKICFEILDCNLFEKNETAKNNLKLLSDAGFKIAIDNYGLELNSLNMLSKTKIDVLKLDRHFVSGLNDGDFNDNIINMLSVYAINNNIKMVAMGIENDEIVEKLSDLGVAYGQGYYFGLPKLIDEM